MRAVIPSHPPFRYLGIDMKKSALTSIFILLLFLTGVITATAQTGDITEEQRTTAMEYFIQGISDFENEDYEQALDNLTAAHLILSEDPGINYALSDVYKVMGDYNNAAYYAGIAANASPENRWYQLQLAEIYIRSGRAEATIEVFDTILGYHPDDTDILYMKAQAYVEFGELAKSNETLDRLIELRGSSFELHLRKFQNYHALQQRDAALAELEKMRETNPGNLSTLHSISQYYRELGDDSAARETLLEAKERNPRDPQTLILLAELFIELEEWQQLGETFVSILNDPLIYPSQKMELVRFIYLQQQRHPDEPVLAEQTRNAVVAFSESEPDYGPAQLIAAEYLLQIGDLQSALGTLERAAEISPGESNVWSQLFQVLFQLEKYERVVGLSERALQHAPDNAFVLFFTGTSHMLLDQSEMAVSVLKRAADAPARRNFRSVIHGSLGDALQDAGRWEEAKDAYEMALRLDSSNHNAMNNYAYFMSVREENLEYALELAERAISYEPEIAAYLDTIGWIHFKMGNYERAKTYIEKSVATGDASPEVYEHLGDVYEALGDVEQARYWWQKALDNDPERGYLEERLHS
jgi:tetratricopeptide (TPR) repeat protein